MSSLEAWTIGKVLTWSVDFLKGCGTSESPRLDAEVLLAHTLNLTRVQLYTQFDKPLTPAERNPFKALLKRRSGGEPVAYITGQKEFMGYPFRVGPAVLIPRPDTEVLVEAVLAACANRPGLKVLDVGTGSGCIAISLALRLNAPHVTAWDNAKDALLIAEGNALRLGADVNFLERDALTSVAWEEGSGSADAFDVIVANPPYISPDEASELNQSVVGYEPRAALFAPPDGLAFYRALAHFALPRLAPGGTLAVEIGANQASSVTAILAKTAGAGWQGIKVVKDYARLDRVVMASKAEVGA